MPKKKRPCLSTKKGFDATGRRTRPRRPIMKSLHFIKDDLILPDGPTPSQNFSQIKEPIKHTNREVRTEKTELKPLNCTDKDDSQTTEIQYEQPMTTISEKEAVQGVLQLQEVSKKYQHVQVSAGDLAVPLISTITSDNELYRMTGVPTFVLFNAIVKHCEEIFGKISSETELSLKECVLLTFMKLKQAFSNTVLSILFKTTTIMTCCKIFHETVIMLANVLRSAIYWPSIEEIKLNKCFQHFRKVRIVIDCIEIPVQRVTSLKSEKTHSEYKKAHTIKYLTAVTPVGQIAFVSKGYPGCFSDTAIFTQCGLIEKLEMSRNEIMLDKGFLIQNVTDNLGIRIIQPFLKKEKQFSKGNALLNQRIAKARVHIERVNQRIKTFDILKKPLPVPLLSRIDDIFIITCAIVNLSDSGLDVDDNE